MGYASRSGRAKTSSSSPQAFGVCQRCGVWYNRHRLRNQYDWRGAALLPLYVFVCDDCYDEPQEQLRAIVVPADPIPVQLALPEPFTADEGTFLTLASSATDPTTGLPVPSTTKMTTVSGDDMTTLPYGRPANLDANAVMPLSQAVAYGTELSILSVTANGADTISVTCSTVHGLSTGDQVAVEALSNAAANGFYSVTVSSATAFSYQVYDMSVAAGSLLTSGTRIITCLVGLPYGYGQVLEVGA